nr:thiamine pyrophosphate-dependent enzyme [Veillonella denticariosi]
MGQNQLWTTQFLELKGGRQLLTSGGLGTMGGYGFPAALGGLSWEIRIVVFSPYAEMAVYR